MRLAVPDSFAFIWKYLLLFLWRSHSANAYYKMYIAFGTGDTVGNVQTGGHADDVHRWATECMDGEALIGIHDGGDYGGIGNIWCKFVFPKKKPSFGIYPYYDYCHIRDLDFTVRDFYCYDKYYPIDTYDTFITAFTPAVGYFYNSNLYPALRPEFSGRTNSEDNLTADKMNNHAQYKCCKLPHGYHLDYSRCQYKYTHDKFGEHYDESTMFLAKCDRDHLMTGMGKAENPWTANYNHVWIQCCPLFYDPTYIPLYVFANETYHWQAGAKPLRKIQRPQYYSYSTTSQPM